VPAITSTHQTYSIKEEEEWEDKKEEDDEEEEENNDDNDDEDESIQYTFHINLYLHT
jgi:hypothetical protein